MEIEKELVILEDELAFEKDFYHHIDECLEKDEITPEEAGFMKGFLEE
jgi:hypothetical protein